VSRVEAKTQGSEGDVSKGEQVKPSGHPVLTSGQPALKKKKKKLKKKKTGTSDGRAAGDEKGTPHEEEEEEEDMEREGTGVGMAASHAAGEAGVQIPESGRTVALADKNTSPGPLTETTTPATPPPQTMRPLEQMAGQKIPPPPLREDESNGMLRTPPPEIGPSLGGRLSDKAIEFPPPPEAFMEPDKISASPRQTTPAGGEQVFALVPDAAEMLRLTGPNPSPEKIRYYLRMKEYRQRNFKVTVLENVLKEDEAKIKANFEVFELYVQRVENFEKMLDAMEKSNPQLKDRIASIRAMLKDISMISEAINEISELQKQL